MMEEKYPKEDMKFEDIVNANIDIGTEVIEVKDSTRTDTPNDFNNNHEGFLVLPTKISLVAFLIFFVQFIGTTISLTTIYVEQRTTIAAQNEKIQKLEQTSFSKVEAAYMEKEIEDLKRSLEGKNK